MAHSHHHDHDGPVPLGQAARWVVIGVLSLAAVAVAIGLVVLWPSSGQDHPIPMQFRSADGGPIRTQTGVVVAMSRADCGNQMVGIAVDAQETLGVTPTADGPCRAATVRLRDGEDKGKYVLLQIPTNRAQAGTAPGQPEPDLATADDPQPGQPTLHVDDTIRLSAMPGYDGSPRHVLRFRRGSRSSCGRSCRPRHRSCRGVEGPAVYHRPGVRLRRVGVFTLPSILQGTRRWRLRSPRRR